MKELTSKNIREYNKGVFELVEKFIPTGLQEGVLNCMCSIYVNGYTTGYQDGWEKCGKEIEKAVKNDL